MSRNTTSSHEPYAKASTYPRHVSNRPTQDEELLKFHDKYGEDADTHDLHRLRRRKAKLSQILMTARIISAESAKVHKRRNTWKLANAGPIGLLGFGMTTILLNLHNTGYWPLNSVIPAMGICFGGVAQVAAGIFEFTRANTFGYVAFVSYGFFWISLVLVWLLPNQGFGVPSELLATQEYFVGVYLLLWALFSFMMTCCTPRMNVAIFIVFVTVTLLFLLLGIGNMAASPATLKAAGYEGIVCGASALYLGFAEILNEMWDRTILPVIPITQLLGWFGRGGDDEAVEGDASSSHRHSHGVAPKVGDDSDHHSNHGK